MNRRAMGLVAELDTAAATEHTHIFREVVLYQSLKSSDVCSELWPLPTPAPTGQAEEAGVGRNPSC